MLRAPRPLVLDGLSAAPDPCLHVATARSPVAGLCDSPTSPFPDSDCRVSVSL